MTPTASTEYQQIDIKKLVLSETNPRQTIDDKNLNELANSITVHGILQPLLVRPHPKKKDGFFEIVSGARRYKGGMIAKLKDAPCRVQELTDEQVRAIQLVENLQRQDVPPLEEAEGIAELMKCKNYDLETIAQQIGKSVSYVHKRVKLLELVPEAKKFLKAGELNQEHVNLLARLTPAQQRHIIEECSDTYGDLLSMQSPAVMRKTIEEAYFLDLAKAPWDKADANLVKKAGSCLACPQRTGTMPNLFDDVKKGDTCTEPECFKKKFDAFVVFIGAEKGMKAFKVEEHYEDGTVREDKDEGTYNVFPVVKKGDCEHVGIGIHSTGDKMGKQIYICADPKECKTHKAKTVNRVGETPAQAEKRKKQEQAHRTQIKTRTTALAEVEKATPDSSKFDQEDFRTIALALWHGYHSNQHSEILKHRGWMPENKDANGYVRPEDIGTKIIKEMKTDLHKFCMYLSLVPFMKEPPTYYDDETGERKKETVDPLITYVRKFSVDLEAITEGVAQKGGKKQKKLKASAGK